MNGVAEFVAFCHDELWDLTVSQLGSAVSLQISRDDPRRQMLWEYLSEVRDDVGISFVDGDGNHISVFFDECGAAYASMIFKVRSTFEVPAHIESARRRDRKEDLEVLDLFAQNGQKFPKKLLHPAVRRIQRALVEHGFSTPTDGRWGVQTRFALWHFRRRHGLSTPKWITLDTIEALEV